MDTDDQIQTVYLMLFPYATYNYDRALACAAINREFKNLCRSNMRHVLLIIGRYLSQKFTPDTPTNKICETLQNEIFSLCLSEEMTDEERAKFILSTKTGIVQPLTQKQISCEYLRGDSWIPLELLNDLNYDPIRKSLITYNIYKDNSNVNVYEMIRINYGSEIANMMKEGKFTELFNKSLESAKINVTNVYKDKRYIDFLNDIIDRMSKGELSVFATWDDVCN